MHIAYKQVQIFLPVYAGADISGYVGGGCADILIRGPRRRRMCIRMTIRFVECACRALERHHFTMISWIIR